MSTFVRALLLIGLFGLASTAGAQPQQQVSRPETAAGWQPNATLTPRLVRFSGAFRDQTGAPMAGTHGLTFALYRERDGGAPIWIETHNVTFDEQGRYTVLLGGNSEVGIGPELFAAGEPRWLGVQLQLPGWQEEPRALLVSVPYALKALDAETLGGRPASAYVLANPSVSAASAGWSTIPSTPAVAVPQPIPHYAQGAGYLIKNWTGGQEQSDIYQTADNRVGIGTTAVGTKLEVNISGNTGSFGDVNAIRFWDGSNGWQIGETSNAYFQLWRVTAPSQLLGPYLTVNTNGNVGIGAPVPGAKLDVQSTGLVANLLTTMPGDSIYVQLAKVGAVGDASALVWILPTQNQTRYSVAAIRALTETVGPSTVAGGLELWTGSESATAPRLRIDRNGNVAIGTAGAISYKLDVNGTINASTYLQNGLPLSQWTNESAGIYYAGGDVRISGANAGFVFPDGTRQTTACGSLAFGASKSMVASTPDDPLAAIIRQQQQQIDELRAELAALRRRVEEVGR